MGKVKEEEYEVIELISSATMKAVEPGNVLSDILSNPNRMLQSLIFKPTRLLLFYIFLPLFCFAFTHRNPFFILSLVVCLLQCLIFFYFLSLVLLFSSFRSLITPHNFTIILFPCFAPCMSSLLKFCYLRSIRHLMCADVRFQPNSMSYPKKTWKIHCRESLHHEDIKRPSSVLVNAGYLLQ
jgi:hypothetical protein